MTYCPWQLLVSLPTHVTYKEPEGHWLDFWTKFYNHEMIQTHQIFEIFGSLLSAIQIIGLEKCWKLIMSNHNEANLRGKGWKMKLIQILWVVANMRCAVTTVNNSLFWPTSTVSNVSEENFCHIHNFLSFLRKYLPYPRFPIFSLKISSTSTVSNFFQRKIFHGHNFQSFFRIFFHICKF